MSYRVLLGDCRQLLATLPARSVQTCVSSPPYYGLRNYETEGQPWPAMSYVPMAGLPPVEVPAWTGELGGEPTPEMFVAHVVAVYAALRPALKDNGTIWVNLGDSYATKPNGPSLAKSTLMGGIKPHAQVRLAHAKRSKRLPTGLQHKDLMGIPWRVAFALQADGWVLRQDIIWHKPNPMPEPVKDRCTKAHEYFFLLSKQPKYYFNTEAITEDIAPSQVGRVRADLVGGASHKERGQHSVGHVYTGARPRVSEADRKALRTDTENRHRSSIAGGQSLKAERPQLVRARELAAAAGLTEAHFDAIRACGLSDAGKNQHLQTGTGQNTADVQRLAAEAKAALGGYYREFLLADTRNKRSVWTVATQPYTEAHFATFPPELIRPCILAGSRPGDVVLDPFAGSGTTLAVAVEEGREGLGIELNPEYLPLLHKRLGRVQTKLQF